jgi:hypothetical protein
MRRILLVPVLLLPLVLSACNGNGKHYVARTTQPTTPVTGLTEGFPVDILQTIVTPPVDWKQIPHKTTPRSEHDTWVSATGDTAYGVLFIRLPLPVGANITLDQFLKEMRKKEGDAILLEKQDDPAIDGIRFVCEGGIYKIRAKLMTRGFRAWVIYAGTLRAKPVREDELKVAERAREATIIGLPEAPQQ